MNNPLYDLMIANAAAYLKNLTLEDKLNPETITIWQISEVLALLTGKLKEDVVLDIVNKIMNSIFND